MKALEPLEIEKLSTELKASIEKARESDPDILHKKIRELQTEVNKKLKIVPQTSSIQIDQHAIDKAVEQVRLQYEAKIEKAKREIELIRHSLGKKVVDVFLAAKALEEVEFPTFTDKLRALDLFKAEARKELISPVENNYKYKITAIRKDGTRIEQAKDSHILLQPTDSIKLLPSGARRLLEVLVAWHPNSLSEGHWRSNAGLRKTGTFSNYKSTLITQGLISRDGDKYIATQSGIDYFGDNRPTAPQTTAEVLALWMNKLPEGARRILSVLIDVNGDFIGEDELLYKSELKKTGTFSNYKSMLMIAKLIKKNGNTYAADKETLFL